jgi:hypothetical protein
VEPAAGVDVQGTSRWPAPISGRPSGARDSRRGRGGPSTRGGMYEKRYGDVGKASKSRLGNLDALAARVEERKLDRLSRLEDSVSRFTESS